MSEQRSTDSRRKRALARRKRVIRNRIILAVSLLAVIIIVIVVVAVSCGKGSQGTSPQREQQTQTGDDHSSGQEGASGRNDSSTDSKEQPEETASNESETGTTEAASQSSKKYTAEEYEAAGVNELKDIPILMYHRVYDMKNSETEFTGGNVDASGYNRTAEAFEADLEYYYENGYRAIRMADYVEGYIDVPFGMSPVVITFDDGYNNALLEGFDADGNPIFQKGCAMEVLERVKARHPDFNLTATFFLNQHLFTNSEKDDIKLIQWMVDNGYDIGNHTKTHPDLSKLTAAEIEEEIGYEYKLLNDIIPGRYVDIIALPYGIPSDVTADPKYDALFSGTYKGFSYTSRATLLCAWTVQESPFAAAYDHTYIKRIRGYDNDGSDFDISFNFNLLENGRKYISDGDPNTIVIREADEGGLGEKFGREVITY